MNLIKKALYFDLFYNITRKYCDSIILLNQGHIFKIIFDGWDFIFLIFGFFYGLLAMGIIKLISHKTSKFAYDSNKFICYATVLYQGSAWFEVSFFSFLEKYLWQIPSNIVTISLFIASVFILYYFWRYRIEIIVGALLSSTIFDHPVALSSNFYKLLHLPNPSKFIQGLILSGVMAVFLGITIYLRKKGVYDFRSRKDKWLESIGEGPYMRMYKKEAVSQ